MKRDQKIQKKLERAKIRRKKRLEIYNRRKSIANNYGIPLSAVDKRGNYSGYWADPSSPTGYSQKCSYEAYGTCQYPCNGDC